MSSQRFILVCLKTRRCVTAMHPVSEWILIAKGPVQHTHYAPAFTIPWHDSSLAPDEVGVPSWHYLDARSAEIDRLKCASPETLEVVGLK